jgi:hypothetical protein
MDYFKDLSPVNSKIKISKDHIVETRYASYERANDYIKHITKVFDTTLQKSAEYDSSCVESLNFKAKLPQINGKYKISCFPNAHISKEITTKIALINAYCNLSELKVSKSKFRPKSTIFPDPPLPKKSPEKEYQVNNTSRSKNYCHKCNYSETSCQCRSLSPKLKNYFPAPKLPLSPKLLRKIDTKPPFVIRSMNNSHLLINKKKKSFFSQSLEDQSPSISPVKFKTFSSDY